MVVPIASFGADPGVAEKIQELLLPDYDVTHTCLSFDAALSELPEVCSGHLETEISSKLGTNFNRPVPERQKPRAIVFGGGVPDEQVQAVTQEVQAREPGVRALRVTREDIVAAGGGGPNPDIIAQVLRKKLGELSF
ncbi:hypothetical protein MFIFM68171_07625 [Madurella fahalii]|uniref:Uncharacterized protein n=1 Tax=Madurella fahalii TaxID=1157608 RepID=A0ABQ0GIP1_9PEZI